MYKRRKRGSLLIPVESIVDINDPQVVWYYIPGFNGYELSNTNLVRSMKHYKKYPYGILIKPKHVEPDPLYEMSDNNNNRISIRLSGIINLAKNNKIKVTGYPRRTYQTDISSRNIRAFVKKKSNVQPFDNSVSFPKFTIIDDEPNQDVHSTNAFVPIESTDGSMYYGFRTL